MGSCQQSEGTLWRRTGPGEGRGDDAPAAHPAGAGHGSAAPAETCPRNKQKRGAKTGEGLNPTRCVSAQHSPADPHRASGLDKNLPLIPVHSLQSGLIPIKSTEQPGYKQRVGTGWLTA